MYVFGDSFDLYATVNDPVAGFWDSGNSAVYVWTSGRFTGGQALGFGNGAAGALTKSSGSNDAVHHIVCAYWTNQALTGTNPWVYLQLLDGATNQCCIVFRSDGAILLTSGGPTGTTLATYATGVTLQNVWYTFEFEVVIHNTAGSFTIRKNGNVSNDFTLGSLNTRTSTNNYANKLTVGIQTNFFTSNVIKVDDVLWRSDPSSVPWVGDVRAYVRMPASDVSVQFSKSPATVSVTPYTTAISLSRGANSVFYMPFTVTNTGTISTATISVNASATAHVKAAIYDANRITPLATSTEITNPAAGTITLTFPTPASVTKGATYHLAVNQDASVTYNCGNATAFTGTTTYASFPASSPGGITSGTQGTACTITVTLTVNSELVNEPQQDGTTTYVYSANPTDSDLYGIASIGVTPTSTVAVTTRTFAAKGDAGARSLAAQLRSGATTTTWNPSDQTATTLSGGNLTATMTGAGGVRSIFGATSGKWYFEITNISGTAVGIGIANASAVLATVWNTPTNAAVLYNGSLYVNNVSIAGAGFGITAGTPICIAMDVGAQLIWFRSGAAGNWNNSGTANPATGTGGVSIAALGSPLMALVCSTSTPAYTANFGGSSFNGAVPSGFNAGLGSGGTTVQSASTALSTSFAWIYRTDTTDPATGAAWTAAGVNAATIGQQVTA